MRAFYRRTSVTGYVRLCMQATGDIRKTIADSLAVDGSYAHHVLHVPERDEPVESPAGQVSGGEGGGDSLLWMAIVLKYHRPSLHQNVGTENIEFSPTIQALLAPSAKCVCVGGG